VDYISVSDLRIPVVNTAEMREVDGLMIEKYGIQLLQMMENAGRNLAELSRRFLDGSVSGKHIIIAAGKGNNGGGGLVAARHLYNWGAQITVLIQTDALSGVPEIQWSILTHYDAVAKKIDEKAVEFLNNEQSDLILDAMIGYGLSGNPRGWTAQMIEKINALSIPVLALDVPSGLDATTGEIYDPCVQAFATMTLALPKTGLVKPEVNKVVGSLYLADISVPDVLYKEMGIDITPLFLNDTIIKLNNF